MHYVYILESAFEKTRYTGATSNLASRLAAHNAGRNPATFRARPWRLLAYFAFPNVVTAVRFERYLKSGSGRAFAKRHFE
jgi:predicted GIY-YIG superfamily endonuclease